MLNKNLSLSVFTGLILVTSGLSHSCKRCVSLCRESGVRLSGFDIGLFPGFSLTQCANKCRDTKECRSFNLRDTGDCEINYVDSDLHPSALVPAGDFSFFSQALCRTRRPDLTAPCIAECDAVGDVEFVIDEGPSQQSDKVTAVVETLGEISRSFHVKDGFVRLGVTSRATTKIAEIPLGYFTEGATFREGLANQVGNTSTATALSEAIDKAANEMINTDVSRAKVLVLFALQPGLDNAARQAVQAAVEHQVAFALIGLNFTSTEVNQLTTDMAALPDHVTNLAYVESLTYDRAAFGEQICDVIRHASRSDPTAISAI